MVKVSKSREVLSGLDDVWALLSQTDGDEKYWSQIRDVKVTKEEGNLVERDATVGPKAFAQKSHQVIVFEPKKTIRLTTTGGGMDGKRTITLMPTGKNSTRVDVDWDLKLKGVPGFVQSIVKGQISKTTENALEKISRVLEERKP